jgi:hypothetical protein
MTRIRFGLLFAIVLVIPLGCHRSQTPAKVYGTVTYKGQHVTAGNVTFHSEDKGSYNGTLNEQGHYEIVDLPTGPMTVTVETEFLNPKKKAPAYGGKKGQESVDERRKAGFGPPNAGKDDSSRYVKIPPKYSDPHSSDLKVTIESGRHEHNFDLKD